MNWAQLIAVIVQYGLPLAERLFQLWQTNAPPTQADWDALRALAHDTARDRALAAMARAVPPIDPASPAGQAILAAVT